MSSDNDGDRARRHGLRAAAAPSRHRHSSGGHPHRGSRAGDNRLSACQRRAVGTQRRHPADHAACREGRLRRSFCGREGSRTALTERSRARESVDAVFRRRRTRHESSRCRRLHAAVRRDQRQVGASWAYADHRSPPVARRLSVSGREERVRAATPRVEKPGRPAGQHGNRARPEQQCSQDSASPER